MMLRRLLLSLLFGGLLGSLAAAWIAPGIITWYFQPPVQFGVSCTEPIQWALSKLQMAQGIGFGFGGLLGVVLFWLVVKARQKQGSPAGAADE